MAGCKRKAGRPARGARPDAWLKTIRRHARMDEASQVNLEIPVRASMLAIQMGQADEEHVTTLVDALNVAVVIAENYRADDPERLHENTIQAGMFALAHVIERGRPAQRWLFDGDSLRAIAAAVEIYQWQLTEFRRDTFIAAMRQVKGRVARGEVIEVVRADSGVSHGAD